MPARKWTPEQRARQSKLIHNWKPWTKSTGARTPEAKKISGQNALNYSMREVQRELARINRALLPQMRSFFECRAQFESRFPGLLDGLPPSPCPPPPDTTRLDGLLGDMKKAFEGLGTRTLG